MASGKWRPSTWYRKRIWRRYLYLIEIVIFWKKRAVMISCNWSSPCCQNFLATRLQKFCKKPANYSKNTHAIWTHNLISCYAHAVWFLSCAILCLMLPLWVALVLLVAKKNPFINIYFLAISMEPFKWFITTWIHKDKNTTL